MHFPLRIFDNATPVDIANESEFEAFARDYRPIGAAGGIVVNDRQQVLMIFRLGRWDFPKGKIEEGENPAEAALREVCEETGLPTPTLGRELPSTFHTYTLNGEKILKQTHWFAMRCPDTATLKPQTEEDITQAEWVDIEKVGAHLKDSYASLRHLWEEVTTVERPSIAPLSAE